MNPPASEWVEIQPPEVEHREASAEKSEWVEINKFLLVQHQYLRESEWVEMNENI